MSSLIWLISSCNSQTNTNQPLTIKKDIPLNKRGKPYSYYNNKSKVEEKIGIYTLENGFDSIQIRIWYGYAFNDSAQLVILKNSKSIWSGEFLSLVYNLNDKDNFLKSISKSSVIKEPLKGWDSLITLLNKYQITTLPDDSKINGYPDMTDGDGVVVEIATKKSYRIYSYKQPSMVKDKISEANQMEKILRVIENEFSFPRLRKF